jgi:hypothetical protein
MYLSSQRADYGNTVPMSLCEGLNGKLDVNFESMTDGSLVRPYLVGIYYRVSGTN